MASTEGVGGAARGVPVDLAAPQRDPWDDVDVPAGWEDVAALAREVARELEPLTDRIVDHVREEIAEYQAPAPVPDADFRASVINNMRVLLVGLAERRYPTADELEIRRALGTRRAVQGLPIDAVLAAYHVGYRELWTVVTERIPADDPDGTTRKLLTAATTVWGSVQAISDAIAAAHATTSRRLEARRIGARQRFVELLASSEIVGPEPTRLARTLGFHPGGDFRLTVLATSVEQHDAIELQRRVDTLEGRHAVVTRGSRQVIVAQGGELDALLATVRASAPDATIATGAQRAGLAGASASLSDAERTLRVVDEGDAAAFEDVWLWATLTGADARLAEVLRPGAAIAASHPHLAAAVTSFADHRFSVTDAARHLELHANTVKYRLDRWGELTGWDPRTFPGLVRSLASIRLG